MQYERGSDKRQRGLMSEMAMFRQLWCSDMAIYATWGTFRTLKVITQSGMGRAANNMRQGFAIQRAQRTERLTRALSIAMPVFAYICR